MNANCDELNNHETNQIINVNKNENEDENLTNNENKVDNEFDLMKNRIKQKFMGQDDGIEFVDDFLPKNNYYRKNNILPPRTMNNREPKYFDDHKQIVPFKSKNEYKIDLPENPVLDMKKVRFF